MTAHENVNDSTNTGNNTGNNTSNNTEKVEADPVLEGFIESANADVAMINAESPIAQIAAVPNAGSPPYRYHGSLSGVEHYVHTPEGTFRKCMNPIPFTIEFEHDYCRSTDPLLQFRVLSCSPLMVHPNVAGGICCLSNKFRPATRLRSVVEHFYRLASGRLAATDHPFDHEAAEFFLNHLDEVRALRAQALWRRPIARSVRVESNASADVAVSTGPGVLS
jgi:hypothetical protein